MSSDSATANSIGLMPVEFLCRLEWEECFVSLYLDMPEGDMRTMIIQIDPRGGHGDRSTMLQVGWCSTVRDPHHIEGDPCGFNVTIEPDAPAQLEDVLPKMNGLNQMEMGILELFEHWVHYRLAADSNFYEMQIIFDLLDKLNVGNVEGLR